MRGWRQKKGGPKPTQGATPWGGVGRKKRGGGGGQKGHKGAGDEGSSSSGRARGQGGGGGAHPAGLPTQGGGPRGKGDHRGSVPRGCSVMQPLSSRERQGPTKGGVPQPRTQGCPAGPGRAVRGRAPPTEGGPPKSCCARVAILNPPHSST
jgi:hypothetical protein